MRLTKLTNSLLAITAAQATQASSLPTWRSTPAHAGALGAPASDTSVSLS
jgi:hypothetical protein